MRRSKNTRLTPIKDVLPGLVDPGEAQKVRVRAILEQQAKNSELSRSIEALKRDEMLEDPFSND